MRRSVVIGITCALAMGGCAALPDDTEAPAALRPLERVLVGAGDPYPADATLRDRYEELRTSKAARRAAAWQAVQRVLEPVQIVAETSRRLELPRFRTWYQRDDVSRIFARAWATLDADARHARAPLDDARIDDALRGDAVDLGSFSDATLATRLAQLDSAPAVEGLGGNNRVSYSPGFVRHLLRRYGDIAGSGTRAVPAAADDASFAPLLGEEQPLDAVTVKAAWQRLGPATTLARRDTSAAGLAPRIAGSVDEGGWGSGGDPVRPAADDLYTVATSDGTRYGLTALHIVTKELRDWMWITLWWSDEPDGDFGADRPAGITGPWRHYKMNVVVAYDEGDADPRGGFDGTLGDALEAVHAPESWASNPFVERGAHNAQTSCIGCHQHAGVPGLGSESILADPVAFPQAARTQLRKNFPFDYSFAFKSSSEALVDLFAAQVAR